MDDDRVTALERRVELLEAAQRPTPADSAGSAGSPSPAAAGADQEDGPLWALEGLRRRVPEPGAVVLTGAVTLPDGRVAAWQEGAGTGSLLEHDWGELADALAALGSPVRLRLLQQVLTGTGTVAELVQGEGVGTSGQVYHHVRQLVAAGWLRSTGGGRYEVPVARVVPLLAMVLAGRR